MTLKPFFSALLALATCSATIAGTITLDATAAGRHGPYDSSTANDYSGSPDHAGFRTFDLSTVSGTIIGAQLHLASLNGSGSSGATVDLFDVSTAASLLGAGGGNAAIYNDLTSGTSYGSFVHTYSSTNTVSLNSAAITDLNSAVGGDWSVGLATFSGTSFGWTWYNIPPPQQLVLTTADNVPEAGSTLLWLGLAIVGVTRLGSRFR